MLIPVIENLDPKHFLLWSPPPGATVLIGAERQPLSLPQIPLPLHRDDLNDGSPSDAAIGQGVYDYLRHFPDCVGNNIYAALLRDAYPHFISDLAAHAVMLDAKQVEPAYVARKLTCLKLLLLLEPRNRGLLVQLCRGYFELAMEFAALAHCREHLLKAMRFGQELLAIDPIDITALSLLAEVDLLFGDIPGAIDKWQRLTAQVSDPEMQAHIETRLHACARAAESDTTLVDDLEAVAEALRLHEFGDDRQATFLLERIESLGHLTSALPSADFYWLLGVCRLGCGDPGGAVAALHQALALEPGHPLAQAALETL
jgi:tetratricopeptide (TPR) repeat protein